MRTGRSTSVLTEETTTDPITSSTTKTIAAVANAETAWALPTKRD